MVHLAAAVRIRLANLIDVGHHDAVAPVAVLALVASVDASNAYSDAQHRTPLAVSKELTTILSLQHQTRCASFHLEAWKKSDAT